MSIRAFVPGDRGEEAAAQSVAGILAGITLPPIEPFGSDNVALAGLPVRTPCPVPDPEPPSRNSVAFGVHQGGIEALEALRRFEYSVDATRVRLVAQVCGAAEVQMSAAKLDSWQRKVSGASTSTELAMALHIPERTAAILEYHACELVASYPSVLAGMETGEFSYRHAVIMVDESDTLRNTAGITPTDLAVFRAKLLTLVANTTVASFTGKARRARERMHPETITTRTKEAFTKRAMTCEPGADGMSWLTLYLPTVSATAIYTYCTRLARTLKNDAATAHRIAQQGTQAGGTGGMGEAGEDLREHRTLTQLRTDIATMLLLNQNLPSASASTNATANANATATNGDTAGTGEGSNATGATTSNGSTAGTGLHHGDGTGTGAGGSRGKAPATGTTTETSTTNTTNTGIGGNPGSGKGTGTGWWGLTLLAAADDQDNAEPPWAHSTPANPSNADPATNANTNTNTNETTLTEAGAADTTADTGPVAPAGSTTAPLPIKGGAVLEGTVLPPRDALPGELPGGTPSDVPVGALAGGVTGDGSGYVDGRVDGIVERPIDEYLEQLETLKHSRVMIDPPLPHALMILTVPILGLLGITDEPAELAGPTGGPVPLDIARKLLVNATTFLRVLTDPISGEALPLDPKQYTVRGTDKSVLQSLAGGCYIPNCQNPVMDTDLDHLRAFEFGGASTLANLAPACKRHHTMRHMKDDKDRYGQRRCIEEPERKSIRIRGWTPKTTEDGRVGWITPTGSYQPPLATDPPRPRYPKWLKKLITKTTQTRRT